MRKQAPISSTYQLAAHYFGTLSSTFSPLILQKSNHRLFVNTYKQSSNHASYDHMCTQHKAGQAKVSLDVS